MKLTKHFETIVISILALNAIFLLYVAFFKKDAVDMEIMRAGGADNFKLVKQLYQSPGYITQQNDGIKQGLEQFGIK